MEPEGGADRRATRGRKYMRAFAAAWPDRSFVQQVAAQIPWFHNVVLLNKLKDPRTRIWYARQAREQGWSRNVLADWETRLVDSLPQELQGSLPTIEEIEAELNGPEGEAHR